jgi:MFS transporter, DHA1 family, multidrug resistance protein
LAPVGLNVAVPLLPALSTPLSATQLSAMTGWCAAGMALGQLLFGAAADHWGRRPSLLVGLSLAASGGALCALSESAELLLTGRFATGFGLGAILAIPRATMRDVCSGQALVAMSTRVSLAFAIMPAVTPPLAHALASVAGWRTPFVVLALACAGALVLAIGLHRETLPGAVTAPAPQQRVNLALQGSFAMAAAPFFVLIACAPAAFEQSLGMARSTSAWIIGATSLTFGLGSLAARWLSTQHGELRAYRHGVLVCLAGGGCMVLAVSVAAPAVWAFALMVYALGHGLSLPLAFALVMRHQPRRAARAAAALGASQMGVGALAVAGTGWIPLPGAWAMAASCCALLLLALALAPSRLD